MPYLTHTWPEPAAPRPPRNTTSAGQKPSCTSTLLLPRQRFHRNCCCCCCCLSFTGDCLSCSWRIRPNVTESDVSRMSRHDGRSSMAVRHQPRLPAAGSESRSSSCYLHADKSRSSSCYLHAGKRLGVVTDLDCKQANSRIVTDSDYKPSELAVIKTSWTVPVVTA